MLLHRICHSYVAKKVGHNIHMAAIEKVGQSCYLVI